MTKVSSDDRYLSFTRSNSIPESCSQYPIQIDLRHIRRNPKILNRVTQINTLCRTPPIFQNRNKKLSPQKFPFTNNPILIHGRDFAIFLNSSKLAGKRLTLLFHKLNISLLQFRCRDEASCRLKMVLADMIDNL